MTVGILHGSAPRPYESGHMRRLLGPALRPGGLALTRQALALCRLPGGARVLDLGCGPGVSLGYLRQTAGCRAVGLDPSPVLLAEAAGLGPVLTGRAEALPFADGCLDAVLCECVLSLTRDKDAALLECARVLTPGGWLIISDVYRKDGPETAAPPASPPYPADGCLRGAEPLEEVFARLTRAGLCRSFFETRDKDIKELAARIVLSDGSLEAFWDSVSPGGSACGGGYSAPGRVGYYLLIAQKDAAR